VDHAWVRETLDKFGLRAGNMSRLAVDRAWVREILESLVCMRAT
jgi:hypothetical protein